MVGPKTLSGSAAVPDYEKIRFQRIQENQPRMQQMGIFDLSRQLHSSKPNPLSPNPATPQFPIYFNSSEKLQNVAPVDYVVNARSRRVARKRDPSQNVGNPIRKRGLSDSDGSYTDSQSDSGSDLDLDVKVRVQLPNSGSPPRRSSRLKDVTAVSYVETTPKKVNEPSESENSEGGSLVENNEDDEEMVDDAIEDETCHQCRQKTLGDLTHCSKCDLVQGKFCRDCLDIMYGENVIEANQNPDWVCPVCRGICSCSVCLKKVMIGGDVVDLETKKEARSTRASFSHVAEDLGNIEVATDIAGEIKTEQRSTRMRKN